MRYICLILFTITTLLTAKAQNTPVVILQKSANRIKNLKSVSYDVKVTDKNMFSSGDTSRFKTKAAIVFNPDGSVKALNELNNSNNGQSNFTRIYLKDTLYSADLADSTYSLDLIKDGNAISTDFTSVAAFIKYTLKQPSKILQLKDTLAGRSMCYQFFIKSYDTVANGQHNFTHNYLVINKATLMPVYTKQIGEGTAEKDGYVIGRISMFNENTFSNLRLNQKTDMAVFKFDRKSFSLKSNKMLTVGTLAPPLKLNDLANKTVNQALFKNKLLLLEFGSTGCAANPLANPVLNRLNKKYAGKNVAIVSIYSIETPGQVREYISANNIEFPVYMCTRKLVNTFRVTGTPNFYLIDKNGTIIKSIDGYSDGLESDLIAAIEKAGQ